jgi:hypothetical protein
LGSCQLRNGEYRSPVRLPAQPISRPASKLCCALGDYSLGSGLVIAGRQPLRPSTPVGPPAARFRAAWPAVYPQTSIGNTQPEGFVGTLGSHWVAFAGPYRRNHQRERPPCESGNERLATVFCSLPELDIHLRSAKVVNVKFCCNSTPDGKRPYRNAETRMIRGRKAVSAYMEDPSAGCGNRAVIGATVSRKRECRG